MSDICFSSLSTSDVIVQTEGLLTKLREFSILILRLLEASASPEMARLDGEGGISIYIQFHRV